MKLEVDGIRVIQQFASELDRARGLEESVDILHDAIVKLGWSRLVYGWSAMPMGRNDVASVPLLVRAFPGNWDRHWTRHGPYDPYYRAAARSPAPVSWSDVRADARALSPQQRDCIDYVANLGIGDGLTVPIHVVGRRFAFVTALGDRQRCAGQYDDVAPLLTLMAHYFDNSVFRQRELPNARIVHLSRREQECLFWSAKGKTVDDIAIILNLSADTVRVYLKRINQKLDATNRTHAVAKALHMGIVDLS